MISIIEHRGQPMALEVEHNGYEYIATDPATYDGLGCPVGFGKSIDEAINDWREMA